MCVICSDRLLGDGDRELYHRSMIGMCLMETGFVCAVGLLLCCGFFFSFLGFVLPSFFGFFLLFLGLYSSIFFFFWVFEIKCKKLEIHVFLTRFLKTRDLCGINVSNLANSASRKRVFKCRVLYGTQISKTRDASLQ